MQPVQVQPRSSRFSAPRGQLLAHAHVYSAHHPLQYSSCSPITCKTKTQFRPNYKENYYPTQHDRINNNDKKLWGKKRAQCFIVGNSPTSSRCGYKTVSLKLLFLSLLFLLLLLLLDFLVFTSSNDHWLIRCILLQELNEVGNFTSTLYTKTSCDSRHRQTDGHIVSTSWRVNEASQLKTLPP